MTPSPMPYVKFWTKIVSSPQWRATPANHRFVFMHLIVLAGANGTPGLVRGSDGDIAAVLGCTRGVVTRAIDRFSSEHDPSIIRTQTGVRIANWRLYQAIPEDTRQDKTRREKTNETTRDIAGESRHVLLTEYPDWLDQPGDTAEVNRLALKYPALDLAEELRDFMAYARRRAAGQVKGKRPYEDYVSAFRNQLKRHAESRPADNVIDLPRLDLGQPARMG